MTNGGMSVFERFGLPPEVLSRRQYLESVHVRVGELGPTRDGNNTKPIALDRIKVMRVDAAGYDLGEHVISAKKKITELNIRFAHNDPAANLKAQISAWTGEGGGPFCYNNRGGDMAMRKTKNGDYSACRCDRTRCPMWLNAIGENDKAKRMLDKGNPPHIPAGEFAAEFPYAKITRDLKCRPEMYLFFSIDDVTAPGEFARLYTGSQNSIRQIITCMEAIMETTGGLLVGIPLALKLVMKPAKMQSKNQKLVDGARKREMVPTVGIVARTTDTDLFLSEVKESFRRREMSGVDWAAAGRMLGGRTMAEVTEMDEQYIIAHHLEGEQREVAMEIQASGAAKTLPGMSDADEYEQEFVDVMEDDRVRQLCDRLRLNQAKRDNLTMQSRSDVDKAVGFLTAIAREAKVDVEDILRPKLAAESVQNDSDLEEVEDDGVDEAEPAVADVDSDDAPDDHPAQPEADETDNDLREGDAGVPAGEPPAGDDLSAVDELYGPAVELEAPEGLAIRGEPVEASTPLAIRGEQEDDALDLFNASNEQAEVAELGQPMQDNTLFNI